MVGFETLKLFVMYIHNHAQNSQAVNRTVATSFSVDLFARALYVAKPPSKIWLPHWYLCSNFVQIVSWTKRLYFLAVLPLGCSWGILIHMSSYGSTWINVNPVIYVCVYLYIYIYMHIVYADRLWSSCDWDCTPRAKTTFSSMGSHITLSLKHLQVRCRCCGHQCPWKPSPLLGEPS